MSEAYERERQNNSRLDELSAKVSALRGVTIDIYDNARAQDVIDNTVIASFSLTNELESSVLTLSTCSATAVGNVFLHDDPDARLRRPPDAHGRLGQQGRHTEALGHPGRRLHLSILRGSHVSVSSHSEPRKGKKTPRRREDDRQKHRRLGKGGISRCFSRAALPGAETTV